MTTHVFNLRELRDTLGRFATGVTVVTALENGKTHGMTANAFVSVSLDPPLVLVSLDNRSHMQRILPAAARYGISVLAEDQSVLSDHFAGRATEDADIRFISRLSSTLENISNCLLGESNDVASFYFQPMNPLESRYKGQAFP